jgi:hypothetical protein
MIQAESVHSTPPLITSAITPESPQDWLDVGDASSRKVFEAAHAGYIGRPGRTATMEYVGKSLPRH